MVFTCPSQLRRVQGTGASPGILDLRTDELRYRASALRVGRHAWQSGFSVLFEPAISLYCRNDDSITFQLDPAAPRHGSQRLVVLDWRDSTVRSHFNSDFH